ncbi:hypothetical protein AVEN_108792-1 [Araneus ventricosus]|uniref:Uncharacterized protein n=1 Tax=Araneus ventricosus TaxID=182803 RepID=A0A4Y2CFY2_ARAVE|nr:hypothetical protein AVEN_108792-1 [Araneus ventricosus]
MKKGQEEVKNQIQGVQGMIEEVKGEVQRKIDEVDGKVKRKIEEEKDEVRRKIEAVKGEIQGKISDIGKRLNDRESKPNNFPGSRELMCTKPIVNP